MKIRAKKASLKIENNEMIFEDLEMELTAKEVKQLQDNEFSNQFFSKLNIENYPGLKSINSKLFYSHGPVDEIVKYIEVNDKIKILPAENCVTNVDTIKYDEKIDGAIGRVIGLDHKLKQVTIKITESKLKTGLLNTRIMVMASWIEQIPF